MAATLTAEDARQSLTAHVEAKGIELFCRHGGRFDEATLAQLLNDRAFVRYPVEIVFDAMPLLPGEFAHPQPCGAKPEDGFKMCVHPVFAGDYATLPAVVLYQLVAVNYGEFASAHDAETFGAAALGLTRDEYYSLLCAAADRVAAAGAFVPGCAAC